MSNCGFVAITCKKIFTRLFSYSMNEHLSNSTTNVLASNSPSYRAHEEYIQEARAKAQSLGLLDKEFRDEIFLPDGILCSRTHGDHGMSVAQSYFGLAKGRLSTETKTRSNLPLFLLLSTVLGIRLSILEDPEEKEQRQDLPVEGYAEMARSIHLACLKANLPSLFPNLFSPASLFSVLTKSPWTALGDAKVQEVYQLLLSTFFLLPKHLHTIITAMTRNGHHQCAYDQLSQAAGLRGCTLQDIFDENPLMLETFVLINYELKKYKEVCTLAKGFDAEFYEKYPMMTEKYLRSLHMTEDLATLHTVVSGFQSVPNNPGLRKALLFACYDLGWYLLGLDLNEVALALIRLHVDPSKKNVGLDFPQLIESLEAL